MNPNITHAQPSTSALRTTSCEKNPVSKTTKPPPMNNYMHSNGSESPATTSTSKPPNTTSFTTIPQNHAATAASSNTMSFSTAELKERWDVAQRALSCQEYNLSLIGERAWTNYKKAIEALLSLRDPRSFGEGIDPERIEDIDPEDAAILRRQSIRFIRNHDEEIELKRHCIMFHSKYEQNILDHINLLRKSFYYAWYGIAVRAACLKQGEFERAERVKTWTPPNRQFFIDLQRKLDAESDHFEKVLTREKANNGQRSSTYGLIHNLATSACIDTLEMVDMIRSYALTGQVKNGNLHTFLRKGDPSISPFIPPKELPFKRLRPFKDGPVRRIPPKRNIVHSLADILEHDLRDLPKVFSVQESWEGAIFGLVIKKLIHRWFWLHLFWCGYKDIIAGKDLIKEIARKDRKRSERGITSIFMKVGREAVEEFEREQEVLEGVDKGVEVAGEDETQGEETEEDDTEEEEAEDEEADTDEREGCEIKGDKMKGVETKGNDPDETEDEGIGS